MSWAQSVSYSALYECTSRLASRSRVSRWLPSSLAGFVEVTIGVATPVRETVSAEVGRKIGSRLLELDGHPALELYKNYLGERAVGLPATALQFPLAIRASETHDYELVRTVLTVDEERQSMTFAGHVPEGRPRSSCVERPKAWWVLRRPPRCMPGFRTSSPRWQSR
jgi:hypothetical protein